MNFSIQKMIGLVVFVFCLMALGCGRGTPPKTPEEIAKEIYDKNEVKRLEDARLFREALEKSKEELKREIVDEIVGPFKKEQDALKAQKEAFDKAKEAFDADREGFQKTQDEILKALKRLEDSAAPKKKVEVLVEPVVNLTPRAQIERLVIQRDKEVRDLAVKGQMKLVKLNQEWFRLRQLTSIYSLDPLLGARQKKRDEKQQEWLLEKSKLIASIQSKQAEFNSQIAALQGSSVPSISFARFAIPSFR